MYTEIIRWFTFLSFTSALAASPNSFAVHYLPDGTQSRAIAVALDGSGNIFTVSTVPGASGRGRIRAAKSDRRGNALATFDFGGFDSGGSDIPSNAAVDRQGNLFVIGTTTSADFPLMSPLFPRTTPQAGFVVKFDPQLTKILFSTRLGGTQGGGPNKGGTTANALTIDGGGNLFVTGATSATDFPVTPGAFQVKPPINDAFGSATYAYAMEISGAGDKLLYSTYFGDDNTACTGGSGCIGVYGRTTGTGIALDGSGAIVLAVNTTSTGLIVTPGALGQQCLCGNTVQAGFLAKLAPGGGRMVWTTYVDLAQIGLPLESDIAINALAVDPSGNVVIAGAAPYGFPVTRGSVQDFYPGGNPPPADRPYTGFVSKVEATGKRFVFSSYFGGNLKSELPNGVVALALDAAGSIWITGGSIQSELPLPDTIPALGQTYVVSLSPDGSTITGGVTAPAGAAGRGVAVNPNGDVVALGISGSLLLSSSAPDASLVGVVNSAGSEVSGEVAAYELLSFYGIGIGPPTELSGAVIDGTLSTGLGGVQVFFGDVPAPLLYAGPNQINAIVPGNSATGSITSVRVTRNGAAVADTKLAVIRSQPEVFKRSSAAIALNQDASVNSPGNPAARGSIVSVWATGAGTFETALADGSINKSPLGIPLLPVSIVTQNVAGADPVEVLYSASAPGMAAGVIQVNFRIPLQLQRGPAQFVCQLKVGNNLSAPFAVFVQP